MEVRHLRKLKDYTPTKFMAEDPHYDKDAADYAVQFIECLAHTKGTWAGKPFELIDWQERIIRDLFGVIKPNGYRQFNTAYIEIPKKNGKSELAAAVALLLTCGDGEERAEVYGCAADRQQAAIVFDVAADMVRMCPALNKRVKILTSQKRIVYVPTNSFYQVLSAEAYSKHGFNIHGVVFDELHTAEDQRRGCLQLRPGRGCSAPERSRRDGAGDPDARIQLKTRRRLPEGSRLSHGGEALAKAERLYTDQVHGGGPALRQRRR